MILARDGVERSLAMRAIKFTLALAMIAVSIVGCASDGTLKPGAVAAVHSTTQVSSEIGAFTPPGSVIHELAYLVTGIGGAIIAFDQARRKRALEVDTNLLRCKYEETLRQIPPPQSPVVSAEKTG